MKNYRAVAGGVAALALYAAAGGAYGAHHRISADALQHFQEGVQHYVILHRQIERLLPPLELSAERRAIQQWSDALALELAAGRQGAREGDIIDAAAANVFRARIRETLKNTDRDAEGTFAPAVNTRVQWTAGTRIPAALIAALPTLPPELQYRLIGVDLALIDVAAGLLVDVLRDALPPVSTEV
jgi:hypothetical protein